jgi:hypothetical protein
LLVTPKTADRAEETRLILDKAKAGFVAWLLYFIPLGA